MNRSVAMMLSGLSGFIALSHELLWYRVVSFCSGSAAPSFAILLGLYLLGLALGAELVRVITRDDKNHVSRLAMLVLVSNLAGFLTVPVMSVAVDAGAPLMLAATTVVLTAALLGTQFPLICHLAFPADQSAGANLSYLYVANIVGSVAGSLLTGLWLMDTFSMEVIATGLTCLGAVVYLLLDQRQMPARAAIFCSAVAATLLLSGTFYDNIWVRLMPGDDHTEVSRVIETDSNVITIHKGDEVYGNTVYDGTFNVDLINDRNGVIRPYSISLFHPRPRRVMVVGLATGSWASVVAHHPDIEEVVVVEINDGQLKLRDTFPELDAVLKSPKVTLVIDDVRRYLTSHPNERFDAIVSNATYHWRAYASALLSVEFFELAKKALNPGGLLLMNTTLSRGAMKASAQVFDDPVLFTNAIVMGDALDYDPDRWFEVLARYRYDNKLLFDPEKPDHQARLTKLRDLVENPSTEQCELTIWQVCKGKGLEKLLDGVTATTDDNMGVEWHQFDQAVYGHRPEK